jgi:hypothetical protein
VTNHETIAAAWEPGRALHLLQVDGRRRFTQALGDAERPAVVGALRLAVLPSGAVLTLGKAGKARCTAATGKPRAIDLEPATGGELAVIAGSAYAFGDGRMLMRFDEASGSWSDVGLAEAVAERVGPAQGPQAVIDVAARDQDGLLVAVQANSLSSTVILERDGAAWRHRATVPLEVRSIAYWPERDLVLCGGRGVSSIAADGVVKRVLGDDGRGVSCCRWVRGALHITDGSRVLVVDHDAQTRTELVRGDRVAHHHTLAADGDRLAFVCGGRAFVLDDRGAMVPVAPGQRSL